VQQNDAYKGPADSIIFLQVINTFWFIDVFDCRDKSASMIVLGEELDNKVISPFNKEIFIFVSKFELVHMLINFSNDKKYFLLSNCIRIFKSLGSKKAFAKLVWVDILVVNSL